MTKPIDFQTTGDDLSELWRRVDGLRSNAQVVKVEPDLLKRFLFDHGKLYEFYKANGGTGG